MIWKLDWGQVKFLHFKKVCVFCNCLIKQIAGMLEEEEERREEGKKTSLVFAVCLIKNLCIVSSLPLWL